MAAYCPGPAAAGDSFVPPLGSVWSRGVRPSSLAEPFQGAPPRSWAAQVPHRGHRLPDAAAPVAPGRSVRLGQAAAAQDGAHQGCAPAGRAAPAIPHAAAGHAQSQHSAVQRPRLRTTMPWAPHIAGVSAHLQQALSGWRAQRTPSGCSSWRWTSWAVAPPAMCLPRRRQVRGDPPCPGAEAAQNSLAAAGRLLALVPAARCSCPACAVRAPGAAQAARQRRSGSRCRTWRWRNASRGRPGGTSPA